MAARDVEKDYYAALGVPKDATAAEIKKKYRQLARELHPDKNPGDTKAENRFKDVSEAYDVLSDQSRRKEYDDARSLFGSGGFARPTGGGGGGFTFDVGDLFSGNRGSSAGGLGDMFGGLFGGRGGAGTRGTGRRGEDVAAEVTIRFTDALSGLETSVRLPGGEPCPVCHGTRARPGTSPRTCPTCSGRGLVTRNEGGFDLSAPCLTCRGAGTVVDTPCTACMGSGRTDRVVRIRVPAGVNDGQRLRVRGKGTPGMSGGPAGDLEVTVHVSAHPIFGRDGSALTLNLPVTFPEATLGATVTVPTLDGPVTLKVPSGTSSGRRLRVRGRGFPVAGGDAARGDLLVTVEVAVPARISSAAKSALEAFAQASPEDPRGHLTEALAAS